MALLMSPPLLLLLPLVCLCGNGLSSSINCMTLTSPLQHLTPLHIITHFESPPLSA